MLGGGILTVARSSSGRVMSTSACRPLRLEDAEELAALRICEDVLDRKDSAETVREMGSMVGGTVIVG